MGTYVNPGNSAFAGILNDQYVDKTGLIGLINKTIETPRRLTCISRPRRFGKSFAAQMLCAYYDRSCDSSKLFRGKDISRDESYEQYLNQYNVIYVDMTYIKPFTDNFKTIVPYLSAKITEELKTAYLESSVSDELPAVMRLRFPAANLSCSLMSGMRPFGKIRRFSGSIWNSCAVCSRAAGRRRKYLRRPI